MEKAELVEVAEHKVTLKVNVMKEDAVAVGVLVQVVEKEEMEVMQMQEYHIHIPLMGQTLLLLPHQFQIPPL